MAKRNLRTAPWRSLNEQIVACERCPRLRDYCRQIAIEKRKAFREHKYWGRPVPNFGDASAQLLIVGLAPAAHGANRTGRMFTGDRSGDWLYRALFRAGFTNRPTAEAIDDGLELIDCVITAVAHCAPPDNKPAVDEIAACRTWLEQTFAIVAPRVIVALGGIAWLEVCKLLSGGGQLAKGRPKFSHGAEVEMASGGVLLGSYHPSQQNTFTGRLTEAMLDGVFLRARAALTSS